MDQKKMAIRDAIEQINKELKDKFPTLTDAMIFEIRDKNLKALQKFIGQTAEKNKLIEQELGAARRVIWAAIKTMGGEVKIPDEIMALAGGPDNQIGTYYDPKDKVTVVSSKESDSKIILLDQ